MNKSWQVVLAFVVVFLAGGAIGSVFTLRFAVPPPVPAKPAEVTATNKPEDFTPRLMQRWMNNKQFNLTPAQREKIRLIVFDTAEDMSRTKVEMVHGGQLLVEHMQDQIASILTPAQRDKYYQLIQNHREQIHRWFNDYQHKATTQAQEASTPAAQ